MERKGAFIFSLACFSIFSLGLNSFAQSPASAKAVKPPFTRGVNMTGWFEIWEKGVPPLNKFSYEDFLHLKELGVDVVRLPVHFDMVMDDKSGQVEEIVWDYLDKVCDWAEELKIYLIIDNHSFNSSENYPNAKNLKSHLEKIWPQVAERYKNRSEYILYEILNEPQISQSEWEKLQKEILSLIRKYDSKHTVLVCGADWSSRDAMLKLKPLDDDNLIYTFHYYDPFYFTHQGAEWGSLTEHLHDIPFPYDKNKMPKLPAQIKGTWLEGSLKNSYPKEATEKTMRENLQKAVNFSVKNNVPILVGEFGVYNRTAAYEDRIAWFETVGKLFQEFGLACTTWGYDGTFSFFKKGSSDYPSGLDPKILKAIGFNVPKGAGEEKEKSSSSQTLPLVLYEDLIGKDFSQRAWSANKDAVMASKKGECPQGNYYYLLSKLNRYESLTFTFLNKDLSVISDLENTYMHLYIKTESKRQKLQVRFSELDVEGNIPWRLSYNLPLGTCTPGEWTLMEIPLSKFKITGAWSNRDGGKWFNAASDSTFDWSNVEGLSFVTEEAELKDSIYLDDIKIIKK